MRLIKKHSKKITAILLFTALLAGPTVYAGNISIPVDVVEKNRKKAERLAIIDATQQALKEKHMGEQALNESVRERIEERLDTLKSRNYKPLVRRWMLDIDDRVSGKYVLEGKVVLDNDLLKLWSKEWLVTGSGDVDKGKRDKKPGPRLSAYISLASSDDLLNTGFDTSMRKELLYALEQELNEIGFDIKTDRQKNQAKFMLQIKDALYERKSNKGTVGFTVSAFENRSDGSQMASAYNTADASFQTTELQLQRELFKRAASKVAKSLYRDLEETKTTSGIELVFYAPPDMKKRKVKRASRDGFDMLAELYGMESDRQYEKFENGTDLEVNETEQGWSISYRISSDFKKPRGRWEDNIADVYAEVFGNNDVDVIKTKQGRQWLVYDEANTPSELRAQSENTTSEWTVAVENLIKQGKLDTPAGIGSNAVDTLRDQLSRNDGDQDAITQMDRVINILVSKGNEALSASQMGQAKRYAERAESALRGLDSGALRTAFDAVAQLKSSTSQNTQTLLAQAGNQPLQQPNAQQITEQVGSKPRIVFPGIEATTRGLKRKSVKKVDVLVADPDGIETITVNGTEVEASEAPSQFRSFVAIPAAEVQQFTVTSLQANEDKEIKVSVTDTSGDTHSRTIRFDGDKVSVVLENVSKKGKKVLEKGRYWALLISNEKYTNGLDPLNTPHEDSDALKQVLVDRYGFESKRVVQAKDATRDEMQKALYSLQKKVKGNDSLLIYYAGHGHQDKGFGGKGFWLPVDGQSPASEEEPQASWLPNSTVHDILEASKAQHILLVSDSCYSGTFKTRDVHTRSAFSADAEFFYSLAAKKSRSAITSGDLEPVLDNGGGGNSLFARHMIDTLRNSPHAINGKRLFESLRQPVVEGAQEIGHFQTPQHFTIKSADDEGGDFIFVPKS